MNCIECNANFNGNYTNLVEKECGCQVCEGCLLEHLWWKTGCDVSGEKDTFNCKHCSDSITIDILEPEECQ